MGGGGTGGLAKWYIYIAREVEGALAVPWHRFGFQVHHSSIRLSNASRATRARRPAPTRALSPCLLLGIQVYYRQVLLALLRRLPDDWFQVTRAQCNPNEGPEEQRYRRACMFIDYAQQHRNILTVCALRQLRRFGLLQLYMAITSRMYSFVFQLVLVLHTVLQACSLPPTRPRSSESEPEPTPRP